VELNCIIGIWVSMAYKEFSKIVMTLRELSLEIIIYNTLFIRLDKITSFHD
jgi:hypothetical protein